MIRRSTREAALCAALALLLAGCSIRRTAVNKFGDALAESSTNFSADEDLELVGDAIPFGLKTMEGLLDEAPRHRGLLAACTSGFVQYSYGWVQMEADIVEAKDLQRATEMRARAQKLYLRAREYGLRGLELESKTLRADLQRDPEAALAGMKKKDVVLLYYTALAWAGGDLAQGQRLGAERRPEGRRGARAARARARAVLQPGRGPRLLHQLGVGALHDRRLGRAGARALRGRPRVRPGAARLPVRGLRRERERRRSRTRRSSRS